MSVLRLGRQTRHSASAGIDPERPQAWAEDPPCCSMPPEQPTSRRGKTLVSFKLIGDERRKVPVIPRVRPKLLVLLAT